MPGLLSVSAPSDENVTSPGLDSSRLSAAFGAAIGAVDAEGGSEAEIDVGDASAAAVPPPYAEGAGASVSIPGVNPGTSSSLAGGGEWVVGNAKA